MISWSDEFSIKSQQIDEQHKKFFTFLERIEKIKNSTAAPKDKARDMTMILGDMLGAAKEHFAAEETLMKHANYPYFAKHKKAHDSFCVALSKSGGDLSDPQVAIERTYAFLIDWLVNHILDEDKQIEAYRTRLNDIPELPYSLEQATAITSLQADIKKEKVHIYVCMCTLKEHEVCESLHKKITQKGVNIRCKTCKQPIVWRDLSLDDDEKFEELTRKYFKQF